MNELIFRALDTLKNELHTGISLSSHSTDYDHNPSGWFSDQGFLEEYDDAGKFKELIWMQYANLEDKNDKKIYEMDICKVTGGSSGDCIQQMYSLTNHLFWEQVKDNMEQGATYEVIGNIYQNPKEFTEFLLQSNSREYWSLF